MLNDYIREVEFFFVFFESKCLVQLLDLQDVLFEIKSFDQVSNPKTNFFLKSTMADDDAKYSYKSKLQPEIIYSTVLVVLAGDTGVGKTNILRR